MIRTLDFIIHSLRSPFMFCGYYTITSSPYSSVFAQDITSWPVKRPCGTSSVASHYLTTTGPTYQRVSTLHSYKKTELMMMVCLPSCNIGRPIYILRIGTNDNLPALLSTFADKAFPRSSFSPTRSWCSVQRAGILLVLLQYNILLWKFIYTDRD